MKNKVSKKFLILIVSTSLLLATGIIWACAGGGDDWSDYFNSFFAPETSNSQASKMFYRSQSLFYGHNYSSDVIHQMDTVNLAEWQSFFKNKVITEDLKFLIYKSRIGEIDT